jgi:hypothetical protein
LCPGAQSALVVHEVLQVVLFAHAKRFGQAALVPPLPHDPPLLQAVYVVSVEPLHEVPVQAVPGPGYVQEPEVSQPVAPQAPPSVHATVQQ